MKLNETEITNEKQLMKKIRIEYFALLKDVVGKAQEELETRAETGSELYKELQSKYGFHLSSCSLRLAVNDTFVPMSKPLQPNDKVVFIPPVAGG